MPAASLLCLWLVAGVAANLQTPASPPVTLYASVTDKAGAFVANLATLDFTLKEDGQVRTIQSAAVDTTPATLILLVDTSGSMNAEIGRLNIWLTAVLNQLHPGDRLRVGRVDGTGVFAPSGFSANRAEIAAALNGWARVYGPTPLWDTLRSSLDVLAKESGYRAIVVLSDGQDSSSKVKDSAVADLAQTRRIVVHAIETPWSGPLVNGKPSGYRNDDLQGIVRDAGGLHRRVPKVDDRKAIDDLNHALRDRYQITFTPKSSDGKLHSVDLRTTRSDLTVRVARKYARQ